ncbi:hypothetical protein PGT21_019241 [Puccinia graminis f. sp. tritici]|uniref:Uncharacterized protein n=1 Tax=Puccinia graminis f. sp. tritici TaxID=56615 RepID=A0A5B0P2M1_PUCGR|nr:hypothetical protein PGT21_019241 [Puccinia graminis f. sp. tritici]
MRSSDSDLEGYPLSLGSEVYIYLPIFTSSTATSNSDFQFLRSDRPSYENIRPMREAPLGPHPGFRLPTNDSHWLELKPTTPGDWVRRGSLFEDSAQEFDSSSWLLLAFGALVVYTNKASKDEGIKNYPLAWISALFSLIQYPMSWMPRPSTPYPFVTRARSSSTPIVVPTHLFPTIGERSTMTEDYSSDFPVPNASPAAPSSPEAVSMDLDVIVEAPPSQSIPAPAPISSPRAVPSFRIRGAANAAPHSSPTPLVPVNQNGGGARARGCARNRGQARGRGLDPVRVRGRGRGFVPAPLRGRGRPSGSNSLPTGPVISNRAVVGRGATPPPAPRASRLPTPQLSPGGPFDRHGSVTSADNSWVEPHVQTRTRVPSPVPFGFYDVNDYHRLAPHQVAALLDRRPDFGRYDQYRFAPQLYTAFYQEVASALVGHFTRHPAANALEREGRVALFRFIGRRYRSAMRRVPT